VATTTYDLPAGAEAFIERRLTVTVLLAYSAAGIRLALAARAAEREFPALADWPDGLLRHAIGHIDHRVMSNLHKRAAEAKTLRLAGEDDDRPVVNDFLRDAGEGE